MILRAKDHDGLSRVVSRLSRLMNDTMEREKNVFCDKPHKMCFCFSFLIGSSISCAGRPTTLEGADGPSLEGAKPTPPSISDSIHFVFSLQPTNLYKFYWELKLYDFFFPFGKLYEEL